jgi:hypothetical protein
MVDGKLYLLPQEVDARDQAGLKATGLSAEDLRGELLELARHGRVLVLLDACHSGATTMSGKSIDVDADASRTGLAGDALSDPEADINRNHLISTSGLEIYLNKHVPMLTAGQQHPGMEVRFDTTVFAVGQ